MKNPPKHIISGECSVRSSPHTKALEHNKDCFVTINKQWTILHWNSRAEELFGISTEQALNKSLWSCFPEASDTVIEANLRQAFSQQISLSFEAHSALGDVLLEWSVYPYEDVLLILLRDITEKRKLEEELQKLSLIARKTSEAVTIVELNGNIIWVNEAFTKITGYSADEAIGCTNNALLAGLETDVFLTNQMQNRFLKGQEFRGEVLAYTKQGKKVWLETYGQPVFDNEGNVHCFVICHTDLSERKKLEHELKVQQKKTNAAVIAAQEKERTQVGLELHDNVNQVLTSVKLYQELILSGLGNQEELIRKSADLLQASINEIRSLSKRLSAPTLGSIKLKDSVRELIETVAATNSFKVSLDTDVIEELEVDEELHLAIYRILQEQLTNILKYAEATNVLVFFDIIDNQLVLKITDNGKGFDTKQKSGGIGITNMVTRAESMNGTLLINSAPGIGCVLIARFPLEV